MESIDHVVESINLKKGTGSKSGKPYEAVVIRLDNGYEKMIFLDFSEMFMLKELLKQNPAPK